MTASSSLVWAGAVGVLLGVAYAASPLSVWFVIVMLGVWAWASRDLGERERRALQWILIVAVAIRVLAIAALFLSTHPPMASSFFWDGDGVYLKHRAMAIRDVWLGVPISETDFSNAFYKAYGWSTYLYVLAYIQYLTAESPYAVHLFNVTMFVAAALVMYRVARSAYGRVPAILGVACLLFLPTSIAWSVSALKESLYLLLGAVALSASVVVLRTASWRERAGAAVLLLAAVAANHTVRAGATVIMLGGTAAGLAAAVAVRRVGLVLCVLVMVPFIAWRLWENPRGQATVMAQLRTSAVLHLGNVRTQGHSYRLLDQRIYSDSDTASMTPEEAARFAVRALTAFVVVPLPWQAASGAEVVFVGQQMLWYVLALLACVGMVAGLRRDALVTCLLVGLSAVGSAVIALNSGNIGTMVRFRDTIVPFVVWLSALGGVSVVEWIFGRGARADGRGYIMRGSTTCL